LGEYSSNVSISPCYGDGIVAAVATGNQFRFMYGTVLEAPNENEFF